MPTKKKPILVKTTILYECRSQEHSACPHAFVSISGQPIVCVCKCHAFLEGKGGL